MLRVGIAAPAPALCSVRARSLTPVRATSLETPQRGHLHRHTEHVLGWAYNPRGAEAPVKVPGVCCRTSLLPVTSPSVRKP